MSMRLRLGVTVAALAGGLLACASLAGLDHVDDKDETSPDDSAKVTGDGSITTEDGVVISPATLKVDFICNEPPTALPAISIKNGGTEKQTFSVALPDDAKGKFTLVKADADGTVSGSVEPGKTATVQLQPNASDPVAAAPFDVMVKAGSTTKPVSVSLQVDGAVLSLLPAQVDFGLVHSQATSSPTTLVFSNTGTAAISIDSWTGDTAGDFNLPTLALAPNVAPSPTPTVSMTPKPASPLVSLDLVANVSDPKLLCGKEPPHLKVSGTRVDNNVVANPVNLDFGPHTCNSAVNAQKSITISNFGNEGAAQYSIDFSGVGPAFQLISAASGPIAKANGTTPSTFDIVIGVNKASQMPGVVNATAMLTLTTATGQTLAAQPITLKQSVSGAYLQFQNAKTFFNGDGTLPITLTNSGDKTCVVLHVDDDRFKVTQPSLITLPGEPTASLGTGTSQLKGSYTSTGGSEVDTTLHLEQIPCIPGSSAPICNDPVTYSLAGQR